MGAVDFVVGILVGILLACVSFVLQTSQVSAIRGTLPGSVANSTVRRHPIQHRYLQEAGRQIYVMKLAGYLFFGTIVGVETKIRELFATSLQIQNIRFLVLDLHNVDGIDFSAAEAFTRINRILKLKDVQLIICGISMDGNIGRSLCNVGLFGAENNEEEVQYFESLNSALEYCENYLLKSFYDQQRNALTRTTNSSSTICKLFPPVRSNRVPPKSCHRRSHENRLRFRQYPFQFTTPARATSHGYDDSGRAGLRASAEMARVPATFTTHSSDLFQCFEQTRRVLGAFRSISCSAAVPSWNNAVPAR